MMEPLFWLGFSILLVAVSLTALLVTAIPAFQELAKAGRSVQKLADTLSRELPPTLEAIRLTGLEISELSDELNQSAKNAGEAVKQVNESIKGAKKQAESVSVTTRSAIAGLKAGWQAFSKPKRKPPKSAAAVPQIAPLINQLPQDLPQESINPDFNIDRDFEQDINVNDSNPEEN
jgi:uncharacterized protein YoxC